jgi:hypothetical protein
MYQNYICGRERSPLPPVVFGKAGHEGLLGPGNTVSVKYILYKRKVHVYSSVTVEQWLHWRAFQRVLHGVTMMQQIDFISFLLFISHFSSKKN